MYQYSFITLKQDPMYQYSFITLKQDQLIQFSEQPLTA